MEPTLPAHCLQDVIQALRTSGRSIDEPRARRVAEAIEAHGGLDRAAAGLANDERPETLGDLLAYRAAVQEASEPALRIARLRRQAEDLDARAEPLWREAAEFHGRSAYRRARAEATLADQFLAQATAAERLAARLEAEALAKRLEAGDVSANCGLAQLLQALAA